MLGIRTTLRWFYFSCTHTKSCFFNNQMVKDIKNRGEAVSTEAKSAILSGLALAGRLTEAFAMYEEIKQEGVLPHAYAVGSLMV